MKQIKVIGKRILIAILVVVLIGGAAYGGVYAYGRFHTGSKVAVYSMGDITVTDDWIGGEDESYGNVFTSNMQTAYVSATQTVTEILVEEGQTVKKGDVLFSYDTTLSDLNLERQRIEIQKLEKQLEDQKKQMQTIQTYRAGQKVKYSEISDYSELLGSIFTSEEYTASQAGFSLLSALMSQIIDGSESDSSSAEESTEETSVPASEEESTEETVETPTETTPEQTPPATTVPEESEPASEPATAPTDEEDDGNTEYPLLLGGSGTKDDPYVYQWTQEYQINKGFVKHVLNGKKEAYVLFGIYMDSTENAVSGEEAVEGENIQPTASFTWLMHFKEDGSYEYLKVSIGQSIYDVLNQEPDDGFDDGSDDGFDDWFDDFPGGDDFDTVTLTAENIASMTTKKEQEIRTTELSLRSANLEYEKMEAEINNDKVVSTIDGTVISLNDLETAIANEEPLVKVSAGGGYYVQGCVGEFTLDTVQVGQKVQVMSYETGGTYEGEVTEISEYPVSNYYYYSSGNNNVSYYPYTICIDESADMKNGESVSMKFTSTTGGNSGFYLDNMFIRTENGESYVYMQGEDGMLHKQVVRTGKNLWGSYTQILGGLSQDAYLAFPYGSSVKEGSETEVKDIEFLYE